MRRLLTGAAALLLAGAALATPTPTDGSVPTLDRAPVRRVPAPVATSWGPTRAEVSRARELVGAMSLSEQAGQVIVAGYHGTRSPAALVDRLHLGGAVPVAENITSSAQIRAVNASVQRVVRPRGYPAFIGVDQEGGTVVRIREATAFPAFMSTGAARDPGLTREVAAANGREMRGLGFTSVLAPVADVTRGPADPVIGTRSASGFPRVAAAQVVAAEAGLADAGVIGVLKHFPGHGAVTVDSHQALPVLRTPLDVLRRTALVPFRRGVEAGASAVMIGHLDVRAVDPHVPASLSRKVVTGLLRDELGFRGVVMTDALSMGAISKRYGSARAAARAVNAGVDIVLMPADARAARTGIVDAVRAGRLPRTRLAAAASRMVALLLHVRHADARPARLGSAARLSARLSGEALTSVAGPCSGRLVGGHVRVAGPADAVAVFRAAAARQGLGVGRGTRVVLATRGRPPRGGVVVALDRPDLLARSAAPVRVATYGVTAGAMRALVGFLLGHRSAPGHLPVRVPALPRTGC
ncbi:beta-N-acetylhexosaminidase [Nocardioides islandensis]|uniref:beta-N-acetylhexosaminidase n=1 Tax=Nocardioides islandensis TaxID=433663 RepID=A0A930YM36_9ACTN|nr:glycoside hydrolase family 3 N-terminal domain-containing protein [Nocardioides islandensis]MBF4765225.1 beta-N-acetylhexosaminidase [Nocardioides islandensis]